MDERNPSWQSSSGGFETPPQRGQDNLSDEARERAKKLGSSAMHKAAGIADSKKHDIASGLRAIAEHLEEASQEEQVDERIESLSSMAAGWVRSASDMLESRSADELIERVQHEMRAHPGFSMAGFFALGFLGARLLRE